MLFCIIHYLYVIFVLCHENLIFAHELNLGSPCSVKFCINSSTESNIENVVCHETEQCAAVDRESSCAGYPYYKFYKIGLKTLQIKQEKEELWIKPTFISQILVQNDNRGNMSNFILKISLEQEKMQTCYNFLVPFSSLPRNKDNFSLPCFKSPYHYTEYLNIQVAVFYKSNSGSIETLILKQEVQLLLENAVELQTFEVFAFKSCHMFDYDTFHFSFMVKELDCLLFYNISTYNSFGNNICNFSGIQLQQRISTVYNPRIIVNCSRKLFKSCESYSTKVSLNVDNTCKINMPVKFTETVFFENWSENLDFTFRAPDYICQNWSADALIVANSLERSISVVFEPFCGFELCFQIFEIYLYKLWSDICHPYNGIRVAMFEVAAVYNQKAMAVFENLKDGNYCMLIVPCTLDMCFGEWSLGFKTVNISNKDYKENINVTNVEKPIQHEKVLFAIVSIVIIIMILSGIGILLHRKCKQSGLKRNYGTVIEKDSSEGTDLISTTTENKADLEDIQICILYSHEKENREKVQLLIDFLRQCGYEVILDDDFIAEISIDASSWRDEVLKYTCTKTGDTCNSSKRFILVESEGAVNFIEYRQEILRNPAGMDLGYNHKNDGSELIEYENEEEWFQSALTSISINWKLCFKDYCHLFVVHFDDNICSKNAINILQNVRFKIPEHLENLCKNLDISLNSENSPRKEKLEKCLQNHPIMHLDL